MRIEKRPSNGRLYLVAVEDYWDHKKKRWRRKVVVSFGRDDNPRTHRRIAGFLHALEGSPDYPDKYLETTT